MQANKIDIKNMEREQWLEQRRLGIGGSDAAAIVGLNPYSSAFQVYCDKLGLAPEQEDNEAMRQGRDFEQYVANRFTEETGKKTRNSNFVLISDKYPFMLANIDRLVVGEKAGLECKTTSVYNKSDFAGGDVPPTYYVQCQHYMAVTGYSLWYLAVLVLNKGFYWFEIPRNENDIAALVEAERDFWENNVLARREPNPDGSERASALISQVYGNGRDECVIPLIGFKNDLDRYTHLSGMIKAMEREQEEIKQRIQIEMKDATIGIDDGYTVKWKGYTRTSVDTKRLKAERPEIYEGYSKTSAYRRFEVKGEKDNDS